MKVGCVVVAIVALLLLLLAGAAGGWWYYTGTPTYSMKQIQSALREHDAERLEAYVDLDALLGDAYDQLAAAQGQRGGWGEVGRVLGAAILKPQIVSRLKRQILEDVAAGRPPAAETLSARPVIEGIESVTRRGLLADVGLRVRDGERSYVVSVRLRRTGRRWRAIALPDLARVVALYERPKS